MTMTGSFTLSNERVHHAWDNAIPPLLTIDSGDTVVFQTRNASDGRITPATTVDELRVERPFRGHPLTGPVFIRGAAPGDALEIEVLDLRPGEWGYTRIAPGRGLLPDDFTEPFLQIWD